EDLKNSDANLIHQLEIMTDENKKLKEANDSLNDELAALRKVKGSEPDQQIQELSDESRTFTVTVGKENQKKKCTCILPKGQFFFGGHKLSAKDALKDKALLERMVNADFRLLKKI
ncbi:MAG: hypothetical protein AAF391_05090, partial [Bacteroidota bacterium]